MQGVYRGSVCRITSCGGREERWLGRGTSKVPLQSLTGLCGALTLGWTSAVVQVGEIRAFQTLLSPQRALDAGCPYGVGMTLASRISPREDVS